MEFSEKRLAQVAKDYGRITHEPVTVEQISGAFYVFGSEIACYRLAYHMNISRDRSRVAYSESRESWFFSFEPQF